MDSETISLLVERGLVARADLAEARALQAHGGASLASALIRLGAIGDEALAAAVASVCGLPVLDVIPSPDLVVAACEKLRVSTRWLEDQEAVIWQDGDTINIACVSGMHGATSEAAEQWQVSDEGRYVLTYRAFRELLTNLAEGRQVSQVGSSAESSSNLDELAEDAPAIEFVNALFSEAVASGASDIHIEPFVGTTQVRLRVDGTMRHWRTIAGSKYAAIASRIKLLSGMDIAERRIPQDGRQSLRIAGRDVDVRASSLPGVWGESLVLRFLGRTIDLPTLAELGMDDAMSRTLLRLSRQPAGMLLVAGPTGSGKTTTVYKLLESLNDGTLKVITIEDPVEIDLPGVVQVNIRQDIGLEFATGLRAILRQDPDVIFVGEIRDPDTARIATQAALTGHLVISTIHTASAVASITRMLDLGVEAYLLAEAVSGVVSQRLLRRCASQDGDYAGRIGIYELLEVNSVLREAIRLREPQQRLEALASESGFQPMREDAMRKIGAGLTDTAELRRVLGG